MSTPAATPEKIARHIRYLVERELATAETELLRAKSDVERGFADAETITDYENDVAFLKEVLESLR